MKTYLVGGAVRDELLGLPVKERDWVIVGCTPDAMIAAGFKTVGKDFPVFLHPETQEEYALARTERKVGKGYKGFTFHTDSDVTLEADLKRRDLTINAIAKDDNGTLIDPYHGQADLQNKTLRHVSDAFAEDPVRILRLARFAAKLPDFTVNPATNQLMQTMVNNGEVDALVAERVWQELKRALTESAPTRFLEVLDNAGALDTLFPALRSNIPDINHESFSAEQRFALLLHQISATDIKTLCNRYKIPTQYRELALLTQQIQIDYQDLDIQNAEKILTLLKRCDAFRRDARFNAVLDVLIHITHIDHKTLLNTALNAIKQIDMKPLLAKKLPKDAFLEELEKMQVKAIQRIGGHQ